MTKHRSVIALEEFVGFGAPRKSGLGIPGPFGTNPQQAPAADQYEISGTGVHFRSTPSLSGGIVGDFNPNTSMGDTVVGTPDQIATDGQVTNADGLAWAHGVAATGSMQGKDGWVAVEYLAPVGWTAKQGKVAPSGGGGGGGGGGIQPASTTTTTMSTITNWLMDWRVWAVGGAVILGVALLGTAAAKSKKGRAYRRLRRIKRRRRR
jgi:hypothetical protein